MLFVGTLLENIVEQFLKQILKPSGALRPGGAKGTNKRGNIYLALDDERLYEKRNNNFPCLGVWVCRGGDAEPGEVRRTR